MSTKNSSHPPFDFSTLVSNHNTVSGGNRCSGRGGGHGGCMGSNGRGCGYQSGVDR